MTIKEPYYLAEPLEGGDDFVQALNDTGRYRDPEYPWAIIEVLYSRDRLCRHVVANEPGHHSGMQTGDLMEPLSTCYCEPEIEQLDDNTYMVTHRRMIN